jgi:hypothetical protein
VLAVCPQVQVECIYEPPQETTDTTFTLLPDSQEVREHCLPSSFSRAAGTVMTWQHNRENGYHELVYASLCIDLAFCVCLCGTKNVWQERIIRYSVNCFCEHRPGSVSSDPSVALYMCCLATGGGAGGHAGAAEGGLDLLPPYSREGVSCRVIGGAAGFARILLCQYAAVVLEGYC